MDSTLSIPAIIDTAKSMGIKALAITDPNLHGAVEFFTLAAKEAGIKPIIGAAEVCESYHDSKIRKCSRRVNLYVQNKIGYANLCRILSQKKLDEAISCSILMAGLIGFSPEA